MMNVHRAACVLSAHVFATVRNTLGLLPDDSGQFQSQSIGNGLYIRLITRHSFDVTNCVRHNLFMAISIWVNVEFE